jgi:hypothetical protein
MSADRAVARAYLQPPANACWRWADNGEVMAWHDGSTVAFRQEIVAVLERLAPQKLPPFPAVALFLAACRGKVPQVEQVIGAGSKSESCHNDRATLLTAARTQLKVQVEAALKELEKLRDFPLDLFTSLKEKPALAEIIFESARVERHVDAAPVLRGICELRFDDELNWLTHGEWSTDNVRHVFIIAQGLKPYSAETLRLRLQTALDEIPDAADLALTPSQRAQRLLDELARDDEHAGLARAARELMAALRLPRRLAEQDELALGGVSDISNHGPLDRLLLTELAHDDLTLAVRVALNEALYLRREPPSREPPSGLALLLDSGVRMWGLPRAFATAVALAFAVKESRHKSVAAWRANGVEVSSVDLFSRAGLIKHLAELETSAHPGAALKAFARVLDPANATDGQSAVAHMDTVLITHRDALSDPAFRRALSEAPRLGGFIATVDRNGSFALHELPLSHQRPLCEATLNLEEIFRDPRSVTELVDHSASSELPAIFRARPFPLLLPVTGSVESLWNTAGCTFAVMKDGRVLRWKSNSKQGAQQLANGTPTGKTIWFRGQANGGAYVVKWQQSSKRLLFLAADEEGCTEREIGKMSDCPGAIWVQGNVLFLIRRKGTQFCDLNTGQILGAVATPAGWQHCQGRVFKSLDKWSVVNWNGLAPVWDEITLPQPLRTEDVVLVFDRENAPAPFILTRRGAVQSLTGAPIFYVPHRVQQAKASQDGHRLLFNGAIENGPHLLDLEQRKVRPAHNGETALEQNTVPTRSVRTRFAAIQARAPEMLILYSAQGGGLKITSGGVTALGKRAARPSDAVPFRPFPSPRSLGCQLGVAEWPNGSKAFLDSRGLLHLKSHDTTAPEITLVLCEGPLAVWCSDGVRAGPPFYCPGERVWRADAWPKRLRAFVESVC